MTSYVKYVEYIAPPFTYASVHAEPDTQAIVGKIGGSWSPFWGGVTLTISHIKQSDTNTEADTNFGHKISAGAYASIWNPKLEARTPFLIPTSMREIASVVQCTIPNPTDQPPPTENGFVVSMSCNAAIVLLIPTPYKLAC